ncbi:hypothetical protein [Halovivax sp.]|nr:hypothetical protein [Halovivax sp.]
MDARLELVGILDRLIEGVPYQAGSTHAEAFGGVRSVDRLGDGIADDR